MRKEIEEPSIYQRERGRAEKSLNKKEKEEKGKEMGKIISACLCSAFPIT